MLYPIIFINNIIYSGKPILYIQMIGCDNYEDIKIYVNIYSH